MFYTYILRSLSYPTERYIGSTEDLKVRLAKHNKGDVPPCPRFQQIVSVPRAGKPAILIRGVYGVKQRRVRGLL